MHKMTFRSVDGDQARAIVEGMETDNIRVKSFIFAPNPNMDGKGSITILYEEIEKPKKRNWLRLIFRRGI